MHSVRGEMLQIILRSNHTKADFVVVVVDKMKSVLNAVITLIKSIYLVTLMNLPKPWPKSVIWRENLKKVICQIAWICETTVDIKYLCFSTLF